MIYHNTQHQKSFADVHSAKCWNDLVFESTEVGDILSRYAQCKVYRHLLLYGPYGSAKSTIAKMLVQERDTSIGVAGGYTVRYLGKELNGKLEELANTMDLLRMAHNGNMRPYVIIDEVDQLTAGNQEVLRGLMDTLPFGKLILTTNSLNKIDGGVADRCDKVQVNQPGAEQWLTRAKAILAAEGMAVPDTALLALLKNTGSARDVLMALEDLVVQANTNAQAQAPLANIMQLTAPGNGGLPTP
jgi:replication factor C subunit 3/5